MASTNILDTIKAQPKVMAAMIEEQVTDLSRFRNSGIIKADGLLAQRASGAGFTTDIPSWVPLYNTAEAVSGDDSDDRFVPGKVQAQSLTARRFHRVMGYSAKRMVENSIGKKPLDYAAGEFARLWVDDEEALLFAFIKGIITNTSKGAEFLSEVQAAGATAVDAALNHLDPKNVIRSKQKMGEHASKLKTLVVHSDVEANMQIREPNAFIQTSTTNINIARYLGYNLLVSDRCPVETVSGKKVYTSYLMGDGVFGYGNGGGEVVQVKDELAAKGWGEDTILSRSSFILHPQGFNVVNDAANKAGLTNAEVSSATSLALVAERKSIPLVAIKSNG